MNELTPFPTTTKPNFFTSDHFTIFISVDLDLWIYGNGAMNISKHTPRIKLTVLTPLEQWPIGYRKTRLPVNGITGENGHFSIYAMGLAADFSLDSHGSIINDLYVKQKIEEHYTYNYPPTTTATP
jgi:hypothetical protein